MYAFKSLFHFSIAEVVTRHPVYKTLVGGVSPPHLLKNIYFLIIQMEQTFDLGCTYLHTVHIFYRILDIAFNLSTLNLRN